jgi:thioredoxin 2
MNPNLELDARGMVRACPQCGQRNRLLYERLGSAFRCSKCHTELTAAAEPIDVASEPQFDALIAKSALPVLVDFWAPWCGPCQMVAPEFVKVAAQGAGRWVVAKVNTQDLPAMGDRFRVRAIPTMIVFQAGREVARQSGAMPAPAIVQFLERVSSMA